MKLIKHAAALATAAALAFAGTASADYGPRAETSYHTQATAESIRGHYLADPHWKACRWTDAGWTCWGGATTTANDLYGDHTRRVTAKFTLYNSATGEVVQLTLTHVYRHGHLHEQYFSSSAW